MLVYISVAVFFLALVVSLIYFISPRLSPIPFFPSNKKDLPMIIGTVLENNTKYPQAIIDLGAGTGTVIFAAAQEAHRRNLKTKFVAVEINPLLIFILHLRRLLHTNRYNIFIKRADIFKLNLKQLALRLRSGQAINPSASLRTSNQQLTHNPQLTTIYLYVGPSHLAQLKQNLIGLPPGTRVASYMYPVPGWKRRLKSTTRGVHTIYSYRL